jgi:polyvinyl alcohol dehydrogenase (cytochrome)
MNLRTTDSPGAAASELLLGRRPHPPASGFAILLLAGATAAHGAACHGPSPRPRFDAGDWNGWGVNADNARYQPAPGFTAAEARTLRLKWAFGFSGENTTMGQPAVIGNRVFTGSASGIVYALDALSGCEYWSYAAEAGVRTAISVAELASGEFVALFGDLRGNVHAVDAETGKRRWKVRVEGHPAARITGSPSLVGGRLYVPVSSDEETRANDPAYRCCTFRGSVAALEAATGRLIWKTYTVATPPRAWDLSRSGTERLGPAGAAVWSSPTVDVKRKVLYVATGNSYTGIETSASDAVLALDQETGALVWLMQFTPRDNFVVGCPLHPNCPEPRGEDLDFGASPVLHTLSNGKQILIAAQKSGIVYGLDPDARGNILWQARVGQGGPMGGIEWGIALNSQALYAPVSDRLSGSEARSGLYAVDPSSGAVQWAAAGSTPLSAPATAMPGLVFAGGLDGVLRAYSAADGAVLWSYDTKREFSAVNGVRAKGGSIDASGPVIARGLLLIKSGYLSPGGFGGNVLLAFSPER